jgi:hypothetical protein
MFDELQLKNGFNFLSGALLQMLLEQNELAV